MKELGIYLTFWFCISGTKLFAQPQYTLWGESLFNQKENPNLDSESFKNRNKSKTLKIGTLEKPGAFNILDEPDSYFSKLCYARLFNLTPSGLESDVADITFDSSGISIKIKINFSAQDLLSTIKFFKNNGTPEIQNALSLITKFEIKAKNKVRLSFSSENRFKIFSALIKVPILQKAFFKDWKDDVSRLKWNKPLCTGVYPLSKPIKKGKRVLYINQKQFSRIPEKMLPKGKYNFPKIIVRYYKNSQDLRDAFNKGEIDFYTSKESLVSSYGYSYNYEDSQNFQYFPEHQFNFPYIVVFNPVQKPMNLRSYRTWLRQFFQPKNESNRKGEEQMEIAPLFKESAFSISKLSYPALKNTFAEKVSQRSSFFRDLIKEDIFLPGMTHARSAMRQKTSFSVLILEKEPEFQEFFKKQLKNIEEKINRFFQNTNKEFDDISRSKKNVKSHVVQFSIDIDLSQKSSPSQYDIVIIRFPGPGKINELKNIFNLEMISYKEDLELILDQAQKAQSQDDFILWLWLLEKLLCRDNLALKLNETSGFQNSTIINSEKNHQAKIYYGLNSKKISLPQKLRDSSAWQNAWSYAYSIEPEVVVDKPKKSQNDSSQPSNQKSPQQPSAFSPPAQNNPPEKKESGFWEGLKKLFG